MSLYPAEKLGCSASQHFEQHAPSLAPGADLAGVGESRSEVLGQPGSWNTVTLLDASRGQGPLYRCGAASRGQPAQVDRWRDYLLH